MVASSQEAKAKFVVALKERLTYVLVISFYGYNMLLPLYHCDYGSFTPLSLSQQPLFQSPAILFAQELIHLLLLNFSILGNQGWTYPLFVLKYVIIPGTTQGPTSPITICPLPLEQSAVLKTQGKSDYLHFLATTEPHLEESECILELEAVTL